MIWDRLVRLTHWSIALLFLVNYWLLEEGDDAHEWAGYLVLAILAVRLIWGFTGPNNARLSSFFPTPKRVLAAMANFAEQHAHTHDQPRHTAIAGMMIVFLWTGLLLVGISGWLQKTDMFWGEDWVEWLHTWSAHAVMAAVVIHVLAIVVIQKRLGISLLRPMLWK